MFTLIELPYTSLAPVISDQTLSFHHGKHLQTYVDNLNKLISGTEFEGMTLEEIVVRASLPAPTSSSLPAPTSSSLPAPTSSSLPAPTGNPAVFNNAGQILNHNLYFTQFAPTPSLPAPTSSSLPAPTGNLAAQITKQWASLDTFKAAFEAAGASLFGSGWVWLQANADGELSIGQYSGADNPVARGLRPLLTFDVWEHAYYLDYQNRRAAHLSALWQIVDWAIIEKRYNV